MTASPPVEAAPPGVAPSPRRPSGGLLFRAPEEELLTEELATEESPAGEESPSQLGDPLDGSPSDSEWSSDESDEEDESGPRSSSSSASDRKQAALSKKMQTLAARQAVLVASGMVHRVAVRSEEQSRAGMYLADEEDAERIGDPLARVAGRRIGSSGAVANPDVADLMASMMGIAGYVSKQIAIAKAISDARLAEAAGPQDV